MSTTLDPSLESRTMFKVGLRLLPFVFILYMVNILDRVNLGFAKLQMDPEKMGIDEAVFGFAFGIFYIGYFAFEVPSNLMLKRVGARRWIARIMISWGIISCAMILIRGPWSLYTLRFLLGLAEAGFFPGIILYLSYWFPARARARAMSRFITASAVTGVLGLPLSGVIMEHLNSKGELPGWQWLFLLEGIPAILLGFAVLFVLTDRPEHADWLADEERTWLVETMHAEESKREEHHRMTLWQAMATPRVLLLCLIYSTVAMGSNSFGSYLPQILKDNFPDFGESKIGFLGALPNIVAVVGMVLVGMISDYTGERRWCVTGCAFTAALGWILTAWAPNPAITLVGLALAQMGMLSMLAPFWSLPTSFLSGTAAAGGIAFINAVGNLGGFLGPTVIGQVKERTGSYTGGWLFLAATLIVGGCLALCARHDRKLETNKG